MNDEIDGGIDVIVLVWVVFGDLMLVLFGVFVLILVGVIGVQLELLFKLENEVKQCEVEVQCCKMLEQVLVGLLVVGCVMFVNGCIGINGNVLFVINFDQLQFEGCVLMKSLVGLLVVYFMLCEEILMVSGFFDDQQVCVGNWLFVDNWELFVKCVLIVMCVLIDEGILVLSVFVVVFGLQQLVSFNVDDVGCVKNWWVEIVFVLRQVVFNGGCCELY